MSTNEPILTPTTISAAIGALLTLLVAFNVNITEAQSEAVLGFVAVVAPFVVWRIARRSTVPVDVANAAIDAAERGDRVLRFTKGPKQERITPPVRKVA